MKCLGLYSFKGQIDHGAAGTERMESGPNSPERDVNLGLFDGEVSHAEVNQAIELADKVILFGEQTRLPYFPEDIRLPRLHAGDPLVLLFWRVLKKIPEALRASLLTAPLGLALNRRPLAPTTS